MLIDTSITVAYRCTSCGSFEFLTFRCSNCCTMSTAWHAAVKVAHYDEAEGENSFLIRIPCIGCDNEHTYLFSRKSILFGEPVVFNCPKPESDVLTGRDEAVATRWTTWRRNLTS